MRRPIRGISAIALACAAALAAFAAPAGARNAFVANESSTPGSVSVIDTATNQVVGAPIPVGSTPFWVAITPDGKRAYVANGGANTISVIDTQTNAVVGAPIGVGLQPHSIAITPDGTRAYVANRNGGTVSVIDTATNTVIGGPITVATNPYAIAITPDGTRAYVANANASGTVSVIDTATNTVIGGPIPVGTNPEGIAVTPDGTRAYVANDGSTSVSVIDIATNTVVSTPTVGNNPVGVAITPDGTRAYIANTGAGNSISVIDTATNTVSGPISFPFSSQPVATAFTPDGGHGYVALRGADSVSVLDTATNAPVAGPIGVGVQPTAVAIAPNQSPKARLNTPARGVKATFKGAGSSDADGKVVTYSWQFGDGKSAQTTTPTIKHTYAKVGEFKATLTVSDGDQCPGFVFTGQTASCNGPSQTSIGSTVATVKLGKVKRNEANGTAILAVKVPGAGAIKLSGKGVAKQRPAARASSLVRVVHHKGAVKLRIKPKGKKKRALDRTGKTKVKVKVTFTPKRGGDRNTQVKRVKLVKLG